MNYSLPNPAIAHPQTEHVKDSERLEAQPQHHADAPRVTPSSTAVETHRPTYLQRLFGSKRPQHPDRQELHGNPPSHYQARRERQAASKQDAKQRKLEARRLRETENKRRGLFGGIAYGFDPLAGTLSSHVDTSVNASHYHSTVCSGVDSKKPAVGLDKRAKRLHQWNMHGEWGLEYGGPGQEGKYTHGSLKSQAKS